MAREIAPAGRLGRNPVDRIGIFEDVTERAELGQPVGLAPVLAVEMAAGMAADVVAFACREPDLLEPVRHLLLRGGEADIRFAGALAGRDVLSARLRREQEDAGEKISEMRAGALRQRAAALPLRDLARAVEGDEDDLLWLRRHGRGRLGWIGEGRTNGGKRGETEGKDAERMWHWQPSAAIFRTVGKPAIGQMWHRCVPACLEAASLVPPIFQASPFHADKISLKRGAQEAPHPGPQWFFD
ncbi:hypothetical protein AU467_26960 [Mesorhizobium loti]|uniref:Uncharacterized protein n=1 Tax=Rhizobium loti TaxID=381 RepID=A0A101KQJ4_RHILI|nr:hypothetical protein AU467_26960 [Mesorhizobium loti]